MGRWIPEAYQDYILNQIAECTGQAMCTQQPTTYFNAIRPSLWTLSTLVSIGSIVRPPTNNGKVYECTVGGTTGSSEPGWGTVQDQTFSDGTVTWKTHDNYALVNRTLIPADFTVGNDITSGGRKLTLSEKMGVVTHTAGIVTHCALYKDSDKSLRYVTVAQTTLGSNELESGRTTIFYALNIIVEDPTA